MNQSEGLAVGSSVDAEIAEVGRDDARPWIVFCQLQDTGIGDIHRRPVFAHRDPDTFGVLARMG